MTDTDTGKRLSDAELVEIAERHKLENVKGSNLWSNWYECNAQREKLLSHIAALTANRGSVSEERIEELAKEIISFVRKQNWKNGGVLLHDIDEAEEKAKAAIQQAVSECSGGGAEEIKAFLGEVVAAMGGEGQAFKWREDSDSDALDYLGMKAENLLRALPLPPSPVKESRDAALIDELRGWKAGEKASDDTVRMIWIMNKAADALEGKLT